MLGRSLRDYGLSQQNMSAVGRYRRLIQNNEKLILGSFCLRKTKRSLFLFKK
ncbi:hypothetical protein GCM10019815_10010 [Pediococcus damnosus]|nr:hypothetical protein PDA01_13680 [Pediococcus damnosus]